MFDQISDPIITLALEQLYTNAIKPFEYLQPSLAVIINSDEDSHPIGYGYLRTLQEMAATYNVTITLFYADSALEASDAILQIQRNLQYDGILVLANYSISTKLLYDMIPARLDIDGLSSHSLGRLCGSNDPLAYRTAPSASAAVFKILLAWFAYHNQHFKGQHVGIIGNNLHVCKPLAEILIQQEASVSICPTVNCDPNILQNCDIIVSSIGQANYWNSTNLNVKDKILIDAGFNIQEDKSIVGDFNYADVKPYAKYITLAPDGVSALTALITFSKLFTNKQSIFKDIG